ncbi:MAG: ABC transporter substrate-binding protein [Flavonifractor plautii]
MVEELHLGTTAANDTFTTFVESGAFGKMCYNSFVTAPFWQTGPNGEVEPFLVTDWTVSEDSTTITCDLALDQGITWHDGEPLTMDDVLFTFDYNINVRKSSYGSYVDHAEQVDEDTIKVVLKEPGAYQWLKLVAGYFYVQPKHIWENIDAPKDYRGEGCCHRLRPLPLCQLGRGCSDQLLRGRKRHLSGPRGDGKEGFAPVL